jgi:quercetin dioxygenase-like cupin family protein
MKNLTNLSMAFLLAAFVLALSTKPVMAQDPVKLSPQLHTVKLDNEKVRVYEIRAKAGDKIALHYHPAMVVVALSNCKLKVTSADGKAQEVEVKEGDTNWSEAQSHVSQFLTDTRLLVIEMKEPQKKEKKE